MFIRLFGLAAITILTLAGAACAASSGAEPTPRATSTPAPDLAFDPAELPNVMRNDLEELGVEVGEPEQREGTRLGAPGTFLILNETEWIEFAQFPTEHFAITQAASLDFDSGSYCYRYGDMLVCYFGDDERVTTTFETYDLLLFAGSDNVLAKGTDSVKAEFAELGFEITDPDPFDLGITLYRGHRSKYFFVDGEEVHIWEYEQYSNLSGAPRAISKNGMSVASAPDATLVFDWSGTPWFFEQGNSIALYVGENREIIDALRNIAGREFAGGDLDEAYPWTADSLQQMLEVSGVTVERQEPENPDSFLTRPSETWLLNGVPADVFVFEGPALYGYDPSLRGDRPHATPHLFEKANAAIYYVGDDDTLIEALESVFGWARGAGELPIERMGLAKGDIEPAPITEVEVYSRRPHMDGYVVMIKSENGGCVNYQGHTIERDGNRFIITVMNRDYSTAWGPSQDDGPRRVCTADLRSHATYVPLDGLEPGTRHTVEVNGEERASFVAQ